jgi:5-methylcytosine-specific restriction endonuclease McrA
MYNKKLAQKRSSRIYNATWRKVRLQVLARDGGLCQIRGPGCRGIANEVDHVRPTAMGGSWYDPINLRAACTTCNRKRAGAFTQRQRREPRSTQDWNV